MIKKLSFILMMVVITLVLVPTKLRAATASDQTGVSTFTSSVATEEEIYGMTHILDKGTATTNGTNHKQNINVFSMKTDGISSKLVTWAVQANNTSYKRTTIIEAAKDYEAKNPGWIVIGGINADQYFTKLGTTISDGSAVMNPSPYYPMITDGDKRFTVTATNNSVNIVGFTNDGSTNSLVGSNGLAGYQLTIIDENDEELSSFAVSGVNKQAGNNDTTLWHATLNPSYQDRYNDQEVSTTNSLFVVEDAELSYLSVYSGYGYTWGAPDSFFCKGYISNDTVKSYTLKRGQFAIETSNQEVINALQEGTRIKVEHLFANADLNNVDEGIGYHSIQKINGKDNIDPAWSQNAYNKKQYPRALVGKKADGTYILITADSVTLKQSFGLNFTEINAVADHYGVTDLYQMDGGGSVTAMIRNTNGEFEVTNVPSDWGDPEKPRSNLSYLFFVKRDPGLVQNHAETTYHSITFKQTEIKGTAKIENIKIKFNNQEHTLDENGTITFNKLLDNTEYTFDVTYDIVDGTTTMHDEITLKASTKAYEFPDDPVTIQEISDTSITFIKPETDVSSSISNVVIYVDNKEYQLGDNTTLVCEQLLKGSSYEIAYKYDIYDSVSGLTYTTTTETFTVTTLSFAKPKIVSISEAVKTSSVLGIKYEYSDPDSKVTKAYILYNGTEQALTMKSGTATIMNLDFENTTYEFKLVIEYVDEDGETIKLESETLKYEKLNQDEPEKKKCGKKNAELIIATIALTSVLSFAFKKRK